MASGADTSEPLILSFDTSSNQCGAALLRGRAVLGYCTEDMARGQAEKLMQICDALMSGAGCGFSDLDAIGVGVGPGNFTGIRISISAARGLALGLNIPAVGVSAFDALRFGHEGPCGCAIDARRNQIYLQTFGEDGYAAEPVLADASNVPSHSGPLIGQGGIAPRHPREIAISHLARVRYSQDTTRPAPLYLRPADAAPARDAPPKILT